MGDTNTTGFPIYDPDSAALHTLRSGQAAHGNNVATLSRNGTGYSVNDRRAYDPDSLRSSVSLGASAWGNVRAQQSLRYAQTPTLPSPSRSFLAPRGGFIGRYRANLGHRQDDEPTLWTACDSSPLSSADFRRVLFLINSRVPD